MFKANQDGAVELYYDNSKKLETTSTGIKVDSTSDAIIDLHHNNSTAHCRLNFSNNNGDAHGGVWYSASSNMEFRTSNNERLRITSSGQIWKRQDPVNRTALKTYTGGEGLMFDHYQLQDSGTYIRYSDIVSIGDGSQGSAMRLLTMPNSGTPQERVRIHPTGEVTIPAGVTLGTAIGSNTSSNTLDDYEEGTYTLDDASGNGISYTANSTTKYVKIGQLVYVQFDVTLTNCNNLTTQDSKFTLPFALAHDYGSGVVGWNDIDRQVTLHVVSNGAYLMDNSQTGNASRHLKNSELNNERFIGNFHYLAAT